MTLDTGETARDVVLFDGPGEMRARCRAHDWAATPLGPTERWSPALRTAVRLALDSPFAAEIALVHEVAERTRSAEERAHAETALRQSEAKYRSLFDAIAQSFCIVEIVRGVDGQACDLRYLEANPAFDRQMGLGSPAAGRTFREMTGQAPEPAWLEIHASALRTGSARSLGCVGATGRWYEISATRLGGADRLACVLTDVTEQKRMESLTQQALEREQAARALAEEATALRDHFIDVVSHELRTPLSAILIWAMSLRAHAVPDRMVDEALDAIVTSANLQHALVDELLDMSTLAAGKMLIAVADESVGEVIEEALAILRPTALARGVELRAEGLEPAVHALIDRARIHQVLWNLLGNALKFTAAGGLVVVALSSTPERVLIEVRDDGQGIDPRFLPHLFDRFRQGDMSPTRRVQGLGLGLSIAREIVALHGGTITAASEGPGRGATFRVELPRGAVGVTASSRGAGSLDPARTLDGRRILLVEDEAHTRAVLTWLLESSGAEVVAVAGSAARDVIGFGTRFDALVCDLEMRGEDGGALLEELRRAHGAMRALALTAAASTRPGSAGFDVTMAKPIEGEPFLATVGALLDL